MAQSFLPVTRRTVLLTGVFAWSLVGLLLTHTELSSSVAKQLPSRLNAVETLSTPTRISIGSIGVDAPVLSVELDPNGNMDIPKMATDVGWYALGAYPGEQGNAVMAGHLDSVRLTPGVFADLHILPLGSLIVVEDDRGEKLLFRVTEKAAYPYDQAPLQEVFGPTEKRRLILITCQGTWSDVDVTYSDRFVVYAELV